MQTHTLHIPRAMWPEVRQALCDRAVNVIRAAQALPQDSMAFAIGHAYALLDIVYPGQPTRAEQYVYRALAGENVIATL